MKKLLTLAVAMTLTASIPAQVTVDLRTGIYDTYSSTYGWDIPPLTADDNWDVLPPGATNFIPALVTNGHSFGYQNTSPYQTFQSITPNAHVISSDVQLTTGSYGEMPGDLIGATIGQYVYRITFNFDRCTDIPTSAQLNFRILTGGHRIVDFQINNTSFYNDCFLGSSDYANGGSQSTCWQPPTTWPGSPYSLLDWWESFSMANNYGQSAPFNTTIDPYAVVVPTSVIKHGVNYIYVTVDVPSNTAGVGSGLLIDGELFINTTPATGAVASIDLSGSSVEECAGSNGVIKVNELTNPSAFTYQIMDPNSMSFPANSFNNVPANYLTQPITPPSTTYQITLINTASGCPTTVYYTIQTYGQLDISGSTASVCEDEANGILSWQMPAFDNPSDYLLVIQDPMGFTIWSGAPYPGSISVPVPWTMGSHIYTFNMNHIPTGCYTGYTWDIYRQVGAWPCHPISGRQTGISKVALESVNVSPNPSTGIFNISNLPGKSTITVTDLAGRTVYTSTSDLESVSVDLNAFDDGVYFLAITSNDQKVVKKLIKD